VGLIFIFFGSFYTVPYAGAAGGETGVNKKNCQMSKFEIKIILPEGWIQSFVTKITFVFHEIVILFHKISADFCKQLSRKTSAPSSGARTDVLILKNPRVKNLVTLSL
jgi:hypothetical protein